MEFIKLEVNKTFIINFITTLMVITKIFAFNCMNLYLPIMAILHCIKFNFANSINSFITNKDSHFIVHFIVERLISFSHINVTMLFDIN